MSEELLYYFQDYRVVYKTTRDISCIISVIFTGVVIPWILARKILHLSHIYRDCIRDSPGFVLVFQPRFEELKGGQSGKIFHFQSAYQVGDFFISATFNGMVQTTV